MKTFEQDIFDQLPVAVVDQIVRQQEEIERLRAEVAALKLQVGLGGQGDVIAATTAALQVAMSQRDRLRELLREARDSVYAEKQQMHDAYGDRLMHKQKPVIELLERIDAALKEGK